MNKKLNQVEVEMVLSMLYNKIPQKVVAKRMEVGASTISDIATGKTWTSIERRDTDNDNVMFFSDLHAPYHHQDALPFLHAVKKKYRPTVIVNGGDEIDAHAMSFYPTEPTLDNATMELQKAREIIASLADLFPKMKCLESNHTSRLYRAGKRAGIPKELLLPYVKMLGVEDKNWEWVKDLTLTLPNGEALYMLHNGGANNLLTSQRLGTSVLSGHIHSRCHVHRWMSTRGVHHATQCPCLIDEDSPAYNYTIGSLLRPQLGCVMYLNSEPRLIPMNLDKHKRWTGEVS